MQLQMNLIMHTQVLEVQTLINKIQRRIQRDGIASKHRKHATTEVNECLNRLKGEPNTRIQRLHRTKHLKPYEKPLQRKHL